MDNVKDITWKLAKDLSSALQATSLDIPFIDYEQGFIILAFYREGSLLMDYSIPIKDVLKVTEDSTYTKLLYSLIMDYYG